MARFDRYLLSQLMTLFGFFSLVLILVYWVNRAVTLFDRLIADGQSAGVFLEFTALSLPGLIRIVLPLAAFVAAVYVTNRLTSDSELIVVQATGYSAFRLARPVLVFGLIVTLLTGLLTHILVPAATAQLRDREAEIARNVTARFLTEGQFMTPVEGITVYIREITPEGALRDLFLADSRDAGTQVIYTARTAYLVRTDAGPQLVMLDGMAQTLRASDQRLFTTRFDDFAYNIGRLVQPQPRTGRRPRDLPTWHLVRPSPEVLELTRSTPADLRIEVHERWIEALLGLAGPLLGFATLMVGNFSRFGLWRQIIASIFLVVVVKAAETAGANAADANPALWPALYLPILVGLIMVWLLLLAAARPQLFRRRARRGPPAGAAA